MTFVIRPNLILQALSDKGSLEKYARLCKCFQGKEVKASSDDGKTISLQKVMRTRCLELFNQNVYQTDGVSADKIEEASFRHMHLF